MMSVSSELIPVEVCKGINGLDKVVLREDRGWSAEVYLFGAHVTSWKNKHGEEFFFSSRKATFEPPLRTHGGIRICFPQFEKHGSLQLHGFARRRFWTLDPNPPPLPETSHTKAFVDLILKPSGQDLNIWPHSFEFRLRVTLAPGGDLILTSRVRNVNTDGKPFSFSFAYHLYFPVIGEVQIEGLETDYLDELKNKESLTGDEESEVDKIYLSSPAKTAILDHSKRQIYAIRNDGPLDAGENGFIEEDT
ncbi:putative glucose-6-phosphate 1-epimerase [Diospyros lotus]|uniref:putative glucose-6-phosphate 1-epimerase n=1 Tax=Diospyros lotus TaxID=55363 RepID=UPI00224FAA06|nr:putative glucose-6-phosphate 1-epimerase [Diospyros lotus]